MFFFNLEILQTILSFYPEISFIVTKEEEAKKTSERKNKYINYNCINEDYLAERRIFRQLKHVKIGTKLQIFLEIAVVALFFLSK